MADGSAPSRGVRGKGGMPNDQQAKILKGADIARIMQLLPHRYPFLLIDRLENLDGEQAGTGVKNVTINEPFFQGHFPGKPVMPGVLLIEAMAQTASTKHGSASRWCPATPCASTFAFPISARRFGNIRPRRWSTASSSPRLRSAPCSSTSAAENKGSAAPGRAADSADRSYFPRLDIGT